jgi:hypothetical protein
MKRPASMESLYLPRVARLHNPHPVSGNPVPSGHLAPRICVRRRESNLGPASPLCGSTVAAIAGRQGRIKRTTRSRRGTDSLLEEKIKMQYSRFNGECRDDDQARRTAPARFPLPRHEPALCTSTHVHNAGPCSKATPKPVRSCPSEGRHCQPDFVDQPAGIGSSSLEGIDTRPLHGRRCLIGRIGGFEHGAHLREERFPKGDQATLVQHSLIRIKAMQRAPRTGSGFQP